MPAMPADEDGPGEEDLTDVEEDSTTEEEGPVFSGYFEKQRAARCGLHALNNCLGGCHFTEADFEHALEDYLNASMREGLPENRADHAKPSGWYSIELICHALNTTCLRKHGKILYVLDLKVLCKHPELVHRSVGAIVNIDDAHWVAIKTFGGEIWLLDSLKAPERLSYNEYISYVNKHRAAYPIRLAANMSVGTPSQSLPPTSDSPVLPVAEDTGSTQDMEVE